MRNTQDAPIKQAFLNLHPMPGLGLKYIISFREKNDNYRRQATD
jgi:hypothetical protein